MKKKLLCGVLASAMAFSVLAGCGGNSEGGADSDVIKIGGIGPLSGPNSTYGISVKEGADLLAEEINAAGGINGKKVEFIFEDDQSDNTVAASAFNKLVDKDGVCAILGGVTSGTTLAIAPNSTNKKIPMITPTGTEPTITNVGGDFMFRGCFVDSFQGEILAKYTKEKLGKTTAAVLYNSSSDYSKGIANAYKETLEKNGGQVLEFLSYGSDKETDFKAQLTKIKSANPDVIILPDYYNVVGLIAKQARDMGITSQFLGGDGWESEELTKIGGTAVDGAIYINHYYAEDTDENVKNFVDSYTKKYNKTPDCFAALSYDTAKILVKAIEKANSTDGTAIRDALAGMEINSVTGNIKFNEERSAVKSAAIIKINGDKKELDDKVNP
ncbi:MULTISPECIES: ABC transporter substrate-binding protein [Clostridium]|uniref:ABC transporter substrate-binding protein n=1 Tax=Clostridium TaxID=1485 RepID=UPI000665F73A|nr:MULTISPECIES: ABC transporter substrate-binding protein [Clostridium]MDB2074727.1 ABC transporter substrate-binding protein [Clostridium paraputrificum]MDB2079340.1 ABC transporter substrate-binding protein [Clostridium paraputrificum]MDB2087599.1 ABC transporter substrate-binding protein [Clostridium paraputrificum]MDB2099891.1 ABC transporter substrate-binding protein [Clostridium paraputrificum]MDB2106575.1 ABC transporter substrate-binding protein [Clostridium paraputrificum]